jgi:pimeloyl-ACP methyl ester carboxylesterase
MFTGSETTQTAPARPESQPRADWRSRRVTLDGETSLAVFEAGSTDPQAPTLILIHGLGHWSQAAWDYVAAELEGSHRLVAFDLPGFGASSKPDRSYPVDFFVAALERVVAALELQHFALAAHSLGGLIAAEFAGNRPAGLQSLALLDPAGFLRTPKLMIRIVGSAPVTSLFRRIRPSRGFVRRTFESAVYDKAKLSESMHEEMFRLSQDPEMTRAFARVYRDALRAFLNLPALHAGFARWTGPTLVVWGKEDAYVPVRALEGARKVYPSAQVVVFEHCGHCPSIEYPAEIAKLLSALPA